MSRIGDYKIPHLEFEGEWYALAPIGYKLPLWAWLRGKWRMLRGLCPECNASEHKHSKCEVCSSDRGYPISNTAKKAVLWNLYITKHYYTRHGKAD